MTRIQEGIAREHPEWILPRLCQQNANKNGVYVAIVTALIAFPVARKFGLDKNRALFSTMGASSIGGYVTAKYSYAHCEKTYNFLGSMDQAQAAAAAAAAAATDADGTESQFKTD